MSRISPPSSGPIHPGTTSITPLAARENRGFVAGAASAARGSEAGGAVLH
jgi:hypothetical protein